MEKKNVIYWVGIKDQRNSEKYGNFEYFEYSKNTWKSFCKKYNCHFVEFDTPIESDLIKFRPNWQKAIFIFDELKRKKINYNQICLVDSTLMAMPQCPNFFELTDNKFTGWCDTDNMRWIYDSIQGYKSFFNNFNFDQDKYINSGFIIFNEDHKDFFESFKELYYNNVDTFCKLQDNIVKKGTEQTPLNYWLQIKEIDVNRTLPIAFKLTHMHRKDLFHHNWQLDNTEYEDKTPFFIKYGYIAIFNGIPKNQRPSIMEQTYNIIKDKL